MELQSDHDTIPSNTAILYHDTNNSNSNRKRSRFQVNEEHQLEDSKSLPQWLRSKLHRSELKEELNKLESRLPFITWVTFPRQESALNFLHSFEDEEEDADNNKRSDLNIINPILSSMNENRETSERESSIITKQIRRERHANLNCTECISSLKLFSYEFSSSGKKAGARNFVCASIRDFWVRYMLTPAKQRHFYEVLLENKPCHLYFDIEFERTLNDSINDEQAEQLVLLFLEVLTEELRRIYQVKLDPQDVVYLDSSSEKKFSCHLICRIGNGLIAFKDNQHMGGFVRYLCAKIRNEADHDWRYQKLLVKQLDGANVNLQCFVDCAVYSRNRSFRLMFSSKNKFNAETLTLHHASKFKYKTNEDIFRASLISNVHIHDNRLNLLVWTEEAQLPKSLIASQMADASAALVGKAPKTGVRQGNHSFKGPSPFPRLDCYILDVVSKDGSKGYIRSWSLLDEGFSITNDPAGTEQQYQSFSSNAIMCYAIQNYRYCHRIGRHHTSNGIYFVVNFAEGCFYQKCHDPECRSYRSPPIPLPNFVIDLTQTQDLADIEILDNL